MYLATIGVTVSAPTVGTDLDTLDRLHDWLSRCVAADPTLGGAAVHASIAQADYVQRAGTSRVLIEAEVDVRYTRGRP